jgi:uncharacterized protein YcgI (DUF1989 family)
MTGTKHCLVPPQSGRAVTVKRGDLIHITDPNGYRRTEIEITVSWGR